MTKTAIIDWDLSGVYVCSTPLIKLYFKLLKVCLPSAVLGVVISSGLVNLMSFLRALFSQRKAAFYDGAPPEYLGTGGGRLNWII